jgi:hypothetical protein
VTAFLQSFVGSWPYSDLATSQARVLKSSGVIWKVPRHIASSRARSSGALALLMIARMLAMWAVTSWMFSPLASGYFLICGINSSCTVLPWALSGSAFQFMCMLGADWTLFLYCAEKSSSMKSYGESKSSWLTSFLLVVIFADFLV